MMTFSPDMTVTASLACFVFFRVALEFVLMPIRKTHEKAMIGGSRKTRDGKSMLSDFASHISNILCPHCSVPQIAFTHSSDTDAYYNPQQQNVMLSKWYENRTGGAIIGTIAHEIAHHAQINTNFGMKIAMRCSLAFTVGAWLAFAFSLFSLITASPSYFLALATPLFLSIGYSCRFIYEKDASKQAIAAVEKYADKRTATCAAKAISSATATYKAALICSLLALLCTIIFLILS